ncbi:STAS domain-containing protein [Catellatospora sichuanensis]|uniref:STAS domain-containing protein n=1 Tax=Catellatospora sichuanensis TaxID=1969805 RepID=UPI001FE51458|nr:STAS domain-containing protein [Catellatospora sichuanensis]
MALSGQWLPRGSWRSRQRRNASMSSGGCALSCNCHGIAARSPTSSSKLAVDTVPGHGGSHREQCSGAMRLLLVDGQVRERATARMSWRTGLTDPLTVSTSSRCSGTVLTVAGRLDAGTSGHLARKLGDLLGRRPGRFVTVDLSGLDFIGGAGIGVLSLYRAAAIRLGVMLRIVDPPPHIRTVIQAYGCDLLIAAGGRSAGAPRSRSADCRDRRLPVPTVPARLRRHTVGRCARAPS